MPIRIIQLGSPRQKNEGLRIGTVRRPPRGVPKSEFASQNWYDVWYPNLSPAPETVHQAHQAHSPAEWQAFARQFRHEMATPENAHTIELLAALSHHTNFSVGCYCDDEAHCHRSVLRELLKESGAEVL